MTKRHIILILSILLIVGGFAAVKSGWIELPDSTDVAASAGEEKNPPLPVNTIELVHVTSFNQTRTYTGTVRAKHSSDLAFEIPGRIEKVLVDEGDPVVVGQALAILDTRTLDAKRQASVAALNQAKALLLEMETGPRKEKIEAAKSNALAAQSLLKIAELNLSRRERLRATEAVSREDYDKALFQVRTAKANYDAAEQAYQELLAGTRTEQILAQKSVIAQLEASLNEVEVSLEKSTLLAPFGGTVSRRYLDPGSIAPASTPVLKLLDQDHLEAWIGLPVDVATTLKKEDPILIDIQGAKYETTVLAKINELDQATRTQTVIFEIDQAAAATVVSGQLCEVPIKSSIESSGFWIPNSALSKGVRGLWSVMAVVQTGPGQLIEKRDIEILHIEDDRVLARGTLSEGDKIVVDGIHRIAEGQRVLPNENQPR